MGVSANAGINELKQYAYSLSSNQGARSEMYKAQAAQILGRVADMEAAAMKASKGSKATGSSAASSTPSMATGDWVKGQNANIDRQSEQNLAQGMSNMIGSGLAGTTAVGGMTAGVGEWATRAKGDVAGAAQQMDLAANESALNRSFQAEQSALDRAQQTSMGQLSAGTALQQASIGSQTPGLDVFGKPMSGSYQQLQLAALQKAGQASSASGPAQGQTAASMQPMSFTF